MREVNRGSLLINGANMIVRVCERALNGKDSRISSLLPRSVIIAGVTALGLHVRNREIPVDQLLVDLGKLWVCEVRDNANFLASSLLDPSGHVELAHGDDFDIVGSVVFGNGLGAQETSLLDTVLMSARNNDE